MRTKRCSSTIALLLLTGCARILGIDGDYVSEVAGDGARMEAGADHSGPVSSAGQTGSGGVASPPSSGGVGGGTGGLLIGFPGRGGDTALGDSGVDSGAGGNGGVACRAGHYSGSFDGSHRPLVTVVGVPATVSTGTVSFDLVGNSDVLAVEAGKLDAKLTSIVVQDAGSMTASLTGRFDCNTRRIVNGQLTGRIEVVNLVPSTIGGAWTGVMDQVGTFTGTWTEHEIRSTSSDAGIGACVPGSSDLGQPIGAGCGDWTAR